MFKSASENEGKPMKILSMLLAMFSVLVIIQCTRASSPTSPGNNSLSLNKQFDSAAVNLKIEESITIDQKFTIKFQNVTGDSRCPVDVTCVWAGNGERVFFC